MAKANENSKNIALSIDPFFQSFKLNYEESLWTRIRPFVKPSIFFVKKNNKIGLIYGSERKRVSYCQGILILTFPACTYTRGVLSQNIAPAIAAKTIMKKRCHMANVSFIST